MSFRRAPTPFAETGDGACLSIQVQPEGDIKISIVLLAGDLSALKHRRTRAGIPLISRGHENLLKSGVSASSAGGIILCIVGFVQSYHLTHPATGKK